jgi:hypothetical protein
MAVIEKRETKNGKEQYRVKIRLKGFPPQTATFARSADAKRWAQQTEAAIREGRHFKTTEAKKHTLGQFRAAIAGRRTEARFRESFSEVPLFDA